MSCGYGTSGFQCGVVYTVDGVTQERAQEIHDLGVTIGLTEFNPTSVDWDTPIPWKSGSDGTIMTSGEAWGMMIGFGLGLTAVTVLLTIMEKKFGGSASTSEQFNTAGRDVKIGLTGSVIVSQWTWAATLLQSSNVAWNYGITGPFWYASGATIQILLFGILAIELKRRCPSAHTFLEVIKARWGTAAHFVFLIFGLLANLIVSAMLLLGGCATYSAVAGVNVQASSFVIPLLTLVYTLVGGLKATFLAGYIHTCVIMVILVIFVTSVYGIEFDCSDTTKSCVSLGSASVVYERLQFMTSLPVRVNETLGLHQGPANLGGELNRQGTYLTMMSIDGFKFGVINIIGNFGTVFVDQSYWQSAIAAKPSAAHKGYILGGMVWFTIPFALATALGLAGNALNVALTSGDAGSGLVPPASAIALFGDWGGILVMVQLTMAILSTGSAECIAVSSLLAYDVYRTYVNPNATGAKILLFSRIFVVVWAIVMAIASIVLSTFGVGLGYVYNFMATALGSSVVPIACSIYNDKLDKDYAIIAAVGGGIIAVVVWLVYAATLPGGLIFNNTANLYAQLYGGLTALMASLVICLVGCVIKPMNFDWNILMDNIKLVGGDGGENSKVLGDDVDGTPEALLAAKKWIFKYGWGYSVFLVIAWPLAFVPMGAFGKSTFQLWAGVALMWGWIASIVIVSLPIYESMDGICSVLTCKKGSKDLSSTATMTSKTAEA